MKQKHITRLFRTLGGTFHNCVRRFPVTVVFVLALTAFLLFLTATEGKQGEPKFLMILGYYLSVGTVLSLSLHLWSEEISRRRLAYAVHGLAQALLAVDAIGLYVWLADLSLSIIIAHGAALLAIGLSVFLLSFFREKDDIPAWNFAQYTVGALALSVIVGVVMNCGLCLLLFSLHQLFGMAIDEKCYFYLTIVCCELLPLLLFLGQLPQGEQKHDTQPQPTAFLRNIIRYLFLPLAGGYLVVLYVYATRILIRWELPNGWVSWLVTVLMAGCMAIELGLYPSRIKDDKPSDNRIARWLPALVMPLLVLMTIGIGRRFLDYGLTINRLYLATLNAWFYFVCIGLIAGKARRISWIPVSFALIFLLTSVLPVNYTSLTRDILRNEVKKALTEEGKNQLPLTAQAYEDWLSTLPPDKAIRINDKLSYLDSWLGSESIKDLVDEDAPFHRIALKEEDASEYLDYNQTGNSTVALPQGYTHCTFIQTGRQLSAPLAADSLICIPLGYASDTLCIAADSLRAHDHAHRLQPLLVKTKAGNMLMLTSYHVHLYTNKDKGSINADINGYLFHNHEISTKK